MAEATAAPPSRRRDRFWADLTGASDRWGRTLVYGVLFGRLSVAPGLLVVALGVLLANGAEDPDAALDGFSGRIDRIDGAQIFSAAVFAPLVESLLIVLLVWLTGKKLGWPAWVVALLGACAFPPLHGLVLGSLVVAPFFGLMTLVQYNWMKRGDALGGYWVICTMHMLANVSSLLTTAAFRSTGT